MIVEDAIHIEAPTGIVWRVTADVERWPEWTPTVTSVVVPGEAPFGVGSVARIRQPAQPAAEWRVTVFEPGRRFAWTTARRGLRMTGTHELAPRGEETMNTLRVEATGVLAVLLWPVLRLALRRALAEENRGLKRRCEAEAASSPAV